MVEYRCLSCGRVYRLADEMAGRKVKCLCGLSGYVAARFLSDADEPASSAPRNKTGFWILGLTVVALGLGLAMSSAGVLALCALALVLVGVVALLVFASRRKAPRPPPPIPKGKAVPCPDLDDKLIGLARRFWRSQETLAAVDFRLNPQLVPSSSYEAAAKALLKHARTVAPGIGMQSLVPQVVLKGDTCAAGSFNLQEEGFFHIDLDPQYAGNRAIAHAILAHEICHYVLAANGLHLRDSGENERLTEAMVFALGFGDIYMAGRSALRSAAGDHSLGYLSDLEADFLYVRADELRGLRGSGSLGLPAELDLLKQELRAMVLSQEARDNLMEDARNMFPTYNDLEIYVHMIERLRRDLR